MEDNALNSRVRQRNTVQARAGATVIYVMSRDQRVAYNHALSVAQEYANRHELPLFVTFNAYSKVGHRTREHYEWMVAGLREVAAELAQLNIPMMFTAFDEWSDQVEFLEQCSPRATFFDFNPLRGPQKRLQAIAEAATFPCYEVDAHNVIPAWIASDKEEFAAHTFRRKVTKHFSEYLSHDIPEITRHRRALEAAPKTAPLEDCFQPILKQLDSSGFKPAFTAGSAAAGLRLKQFIDTELALYAVNRNDPAKDGLSGFSPYLHFGHISSLQIVHALQAEAPALATDGFLLEREPLLAKVSDDKNPTIIESCNVLAEEMIVRKELADNYCLYNDTYDSLAGAKDWAKKTIQEHAGDKREYLYSQDELESAVTHDEAWNAAQSEMMQSGKMHGYMRMYWAKKILEWTPDVEAAIKIAIYLNDRYSIDGGDPNGYTGIMWSIAGVHDRAWNERHIFGKIRYMNAAGLRRKFAIDTYIERWSKQSKLL